MQALFLTITILVLISEGKSNIPQSYEIQGVPYYRQQTEWSCGDASLQMVLNFWGTPIADQLQIIDVARTQSSEGTLSLDIVRTGKYSRLSSSVGTVFPNATTVDGFPGRPRGLAAFWYDSETPWMNEAFEIISQNVPLILLMHYSVNGTRDGHFRVLIGYNYTNQSVTLLDPWDREGNPRVLYWSFSDFLSAWNYREQPPTPRINPFFGAALYTWSVQVQVVPISERLVTVKSRISYPIFRPVTNPSSPASPVIISLNMLNNSDIVKFSGGNSPSNVLGKLSEGDWYDASWTIECIIDNCKNVKIQSEVTAEGIIVGNVPLSSENYPGYDFVDVIGGHAAFTLTFSQ